MPEPACADLIERCRDRPVRVLDISGVQDRDPEIWLQLFPDADRIVVCRPRPAVGERPSDDPRVTMLPVDATTPESRAAILKVSTSFDVIVASGARGGIDAARSFAAFFPHLSGDGVYVVEDLRHRRSVPGSEDDGSPSAPVVFRFLAGLVSDDSRTPPASIVSAPHADLDTDSLMAIKEVVFHDSVCLVSKSGNGESQDTAGETKRLSRIGELDQARRDVEHLSTQLARARAAPFRVLAQLLLHRLLVALGKACPPVPKRMAKRFSKSAAKRHPYRSELTYTTEGSKTEYQMVLASWDRQRQARAREIRHLGNRLAGGPLISVAMVVRDSDPAHLDETIRSVHAQSYDNWELCVVIDDTAGSGIRDSLHAARSADRRVRVLAGLDENDAIAEARGTYTALIEPDDLLDRDALLHVAERLDSQPGAKVIYTDHDRIDADGRRSAPHFKPDWNRELAYGMDYVSGLAVYETEMLRDAEGVRPELGAARNHELLLRCVADLPDARIQHVSRVLCSRRPELPASPTLQSAARRAVARHLRAAIGSEITVRPGPFPFTYISEWTPPAMPLVSIVIPTRDHLALTRMTVESILDRTSYDDYEIIIVDNGSVEPGTLAWFAEISADSRVRVRRDDRPFNYSALNNAAIKEARGEIVALVNNDIEVVSPGWLTEMVRLALRPEVGCVGAKLHYPDGRIQHGGIVLGLGGTAGHSHKFYPGDHPGYFGRLMLRQEYSAVTGACLVVRRSIYDEVGGLNEEALSVAFNDVDFCLKVGAAGYRNLWTPLAQLVHHESASRKTEDTPEKKARFRSETDYMLSTWADRLRRDPAYNRNLSGEHDDFRFAPPDW